MIREIVIIKDGLPLLQKSFSGFSGLKSPFSCPDNLIMMSGFFSAINSFSDQIEGLGKICELKLSNDDDYKLSFLQDPSLPNLIFLATFDEKSKGVNVQRTLKKISKTFLQKYNIESLLKWRGRRNTFEAFEDTLLDYVEEEKQENELMFKEKVIKLIGKVNKEINEDKRVCENEGHPEYQNYIPVFKIKKKINPWHYLTGRVSINVFKKIDDKKNIGQIAIELDLTLKQVYNACKNLLKLGFIFLNDH